MDSNKSTDFPSLFPNNQTSNLKNEISDNDVKEGNQNLLEKNVDKTGIPSVFSNEISVASTSLYSLKDDLQSKILKLKVEKELVTKKNGNLPTLYLNKDYLTKDIMIENKELKMNHKSNNCEMGGHKKLSEEYSTIQNFHHHSKVNKLKRKIREDNEMLTKKSMKEDNKIPESNENDSDNLSGIYPKTSTQLSPKCLPSFSISDNIGTVIETSTESFESKLLSSGFISVYETQASLPLKEYKQVNESKTIKAIRNKACRSTLQGYDCECCSGYYNALQLKTPEKLQRINEVSRHRGINFKCDKTPEGYWDKNFLEKSEQKKRGLFIESNSPIKNKKYRKKLTFSREFSETTNNFEE